jgi:hypothetical protein
MVPRHWLTKHPLCANTHYRWRTRTRFPADTPLHDAGRRAAGSPSRRAHPRPGFPLSPQAAFEPPTGWCERINTRVHRTTRAVVTERLAEERQRMRAPPAICPTQHRRGSCNRGKRHREISELVDPPGPRAGPPRNRSDSRSTVEHKARGRHARARPPARPARRAHAPRPEHRTRQAAATCRSQAADGVRAPSLPVGSLSQCVSTAGIVREWPACLALCRWWASIVDARWTPEGPSRLIVARPIRSASGKAAYRRPHDYLHCGDAPSVGGRSRIPLREFIAPAGFEPATSRL